MMDMPILFYQEKAATEYFWETETENLTLVQP